MTIFRHLFFKLHIKTGGTFRRNDLPEADGKALRLRTESILNELLATSKVFDQQAKESDWDVEKVDWRLVSLTESVGH